jgi:anti-sigma regulatory factor (Ser/Thr protein kinase)
MKTLYVFCGSFLLLWIVNIQNATAQNNCNCTTIQPQQFYQHLQAGDTVAAKQFIQQLKQSANKGCQILAYNFEVELQATYRKVEQMLALTIEQEKALQRQPCKDQLIENVYLNYARYYKAKQDFELLSKYGFMALASAEQTKNIPNQIKALVYINFLFGRQNQDDKSWLYFKKAEQIILSKAADYTSAEQYNYLAFAYETKYTQTQNSSLLDTALRFATKAKLLAKQYNDHLQLVQAFRVFDAVAYHRGEINQSAAYIDSALYYAKQMKVPTNLSALYIAKAWSYIDRNNPAEAIRWQDTSIHYAEKFEAGTIPTMNVYLEASTIFKEAGNTEKAFNAFKKHAHLKDSLFNLQRTEKINELEQRYEKVKNEKTINELAQAKKVYLLLLLAGVLALIGLLFFIRQQHLKNKQKVLEAEQRLNRSRMNPHFFFNALSALQSFALQGNDGKFMASNLSKFSHIMRQTLESTYEDYVTVEQEIDFLNEYLSLQKLRFPNKFAYNITFDDELAYDEVLIPSMIVQPFAENSIEHGFSDMIEAGLLTIHFSQTAGTLIVTITDNGKGLLTTVKSPSDHISRASQIIKDRIYLLNIKLKTKASFSIDNNADGNGVIVIIKLPLLYKHKIV